MSQNQETVAERLVSIIQRIQLERRSGTLIARRGEGILQEEGVITFQKGQVSHTTLGRYTGSEALNMLTRWGKCRFVFLASDSDSKRPSSPLSLSGMEPTTGPIQQSPQTTPLPVSNSGIAGQDLHAPAPYRLQPADVALHQIDSMGLSRPHRRLFLLIDGQRPLHELVRLMGRNEQEIATLLRELEQAGLILFPGSYLFPP